MLFCSYRGARHGLTMSAKLARLEQQEAEFMAKYGKKSQPTSASTVCVAPMTSQSSERLGETANDPQRKKMKKKRSGGNISELNGDDVSENPETDVKPKKKKKMVYEKAEEITDAVSTEEGAMCVENGEVDHSHKTKRKHKKKKNKAEENDEEIAPSSAVDCRSPEEMPELHTDAKVKKKKKKSSKHSKEEESNYAESNQPEVVQDCAPKTKKEVAGKESVKQCKKGKLSMDVNVNVDGLNKEERPPKKKKKSKE